MILIYLRQKYPYIFELKSLKSNPLGNRKIGTYPIFWTLQKARYPAGAMVPLRIGSQEKSLQEQVRELGGRWDRSQHLWFIPYACIAWTTLEKFIVLETRKGATE